MHKLVYSGLIRLLFPHEISINQIFLALKSKENVGEGRIKQNFCYRKLLCIIMWLG